MNFVVKLGFAVLVATAGCASASPTSTPPPGADASLDAGDDASQAVDSTTPPPDAGAPDIYVAPEASPTGCPDGLAIGTAGNCGGCGLSCTAPETCSNNACSCAGAAACSFPLTCTAGAGSAGCCAAPEKFCGASGCAACCADSDCGNGVLCCGGICTPRGDANCASCGQACVWPMACGTDFTCSVNECLPKASQCSAPAECCSLSCVAGLCQ